MTSLLNLTRRRFVQGGLALAATAPWGPAWAEPTDLTFLAVGDWGREGKHGQQEVADRMAETAKRLDAKFVLSVGDNFYEDGVADIHDPAWKTSFEQVYAAPSLQVPWYAALGNHDYQGNAQAQIDYSASSRRWRMPGRWFAFDTTAPDRTTLKILVVDTTPMILAYYGFGQEKVKVQDQAKTVQTQLDWLDRELAASKADWNIVVGHHPVYSGKDPDALPTAELGERVTGGSPDLIARLAPVLDQHRVPLYLNGHDHILQHVRHGATDYVCTGAGSKLRDICDMGGSDFCVKDHGFVAVALNAKRLRLAYQDRAGTELHVLEIPRPA